MEQSQKSHPIEYMLYVLLYMIITCAKHSVCVCMLCMSTDFIPPF